MSAGNGHRDILVNAPSISVVLGEIEAAVSEGKFEGSGRMGGLGVVSGGFYVF